MRVVQHIQRFVYSHSLSASKRWVIHGRGMTERGVNWIDALPNLAATCACSAALPVIARGKEISILSKRGDQLFRIITLAGRISNHAFLTRPENESAFIYLRHEWGDTNSHKINNQIWHCSGTYKKICGNSHPLKTKTHCSTLTPTPCV